VKKSDRFSERVRRELRADLRGKDRAKLERLRAAVVAARALKRERLHAVTTACQAQRAALRERCAAERASVRSEGNATLADRGAKLRAERDDQRRTVLAGRDGARPVAKGGRRRSLERREESDDEVRANLGPDLLPVFERVKRGIRGTPRATRTETFLEWAEANPAEVYSIIEADAARALARLERSEREHAKAMASRTRYARHPAALEAAVTAPEDDDVPF